MEFINLLKDIVSKKILKVIIAILLISVVLYKIELIKLSCLFTLDKISEYPFSILAVILLISLLVLFKISNYKSNKYANEEWDRSNVPFKISTDDFRDIYFVLIDRHKTEKNINYMSFRIVNNNMNADIKNIKGKVSLYSASSEAHQKKSLVEHFDINSLSRKTEYEIASVPITLEIYNWQHFESEIEVLEFEDNTQYKDIKLRSRMIVKNTAWILNHMRLYDYEIFFIKTRWNLKWLKDKKNKLRLLIRHKCSRNIFYFGMRAKRELKSDLRKDFLQRWMYRIIFSVMIPTVIILIVYSLFQLGGLLFVLLQALGKFVTDIMKI